MDETISRTTCIEIEAQLVRRIERGDHRAETDLVSRFQGPIRRMLGRITLDPSLVDDVCQDTFCAVIDQIRRGRLRDPERLRGFLRGTARNLLYAAHRREQRSLDELPDWLPDPTEPAPARSPLGRVLDHEATERLIRGLMALRLDRDRQLLTRVYLAEESKETVCDALGLPMEQYKKALFRARRRLRVLVERAEKREAISPAFKTPDQADAYAA